MAQKGLLYFLAFRGFFWESIAQEHRGGTSFFGHERRVRKRFVWHPTWILTCQSFTYLRKYQRPLKSLSSRSISPLNCRNSSALRCIHCPEGGRNPKLSYFLCIFHSKVLFIYKTHFWNHVLKTRFLFSKKRVFLQTTLLETTLKNTLLLNKKRVFKAWFQKCVL